jgi:hypothetical protein
VDTVIGLLLLLVFVACVVALAAGTTWLIVKADAAVRRLRGKSEPATDA